MKISSTEPKKPKYYPQTAILRIFSVIFVILKIKNCTILKTVITTETTQRRYDYT
jgi:hypothetical protein